MLKLLAKIFIKNEAQLPETERRRKYGMLSGGYGIFLNLILGAAKLFAGLISGSLAIMADAANNLTDASSSLVSLLGFRLAGKEADENHPFGHARFEYIAGLIVAMFIIVMGFELLISSIKKILQPEAINFSLLSLIILLISVFIKFHMMIYNRRLGKQFSSAVLFATAADSMSDCIATSVVLLSMLLGHFTTLTPDAYAGGLVALFILYTGIKEAKVLISHLLGHSPDPELVHRIEQLVLEDAFVLGIHDLLVHDYGPGHCLVSLHAEVSPHEDLLKIHEAIDTIELRIRRELGCPAIVHIDPVDMEDAETLRIRKDLEEKLKALSPEVTIHDFRFLTRQGKKILFFDVSAPFSLKMSKEQIRLSVDQLVKELDPSLSAMIEIDRPYAAGD
ncbi:MAG: cation diffusion facilitator family transporter [Bacillota bacterium]|nr:cation diffusion facilitator family transporter [Bacillota bacterium]